MTLSVELFTSIVHHYFQKGVCTSSLGSESDRTRSDDIRTKFEHKYRIQHLTEQHESNVRVIFWTPTPATPLEIFTHTHRMKINNFSRLKPSELIFNELCPSDRVYRTRCFHSRDSRLHFFFVFSYFCIYSVFFILFI